MKITDCILCEDIRQEADNKQSLMGVFGDNIRVKVPSSKEKVKKPISFRLGIFVRVEFDEQDGISNPLLVELGIEHAGDTISAGKGSISLDNIKVSNKLVLSALMTNFPVKENGDLKIIVNMLDKKGKKVKSISPTYPTKIEVVYLSHS